MSSADPSSGDSLAMVLAYYGMIDVISSDREKVVCPFHADENPSMAIDFESGRFYCFGCGASGDALDFVRRMERQGNRWAGTVPKGPQKGSQAVSEGFVRRGL